MSGRVRILRAAALWATLVVGLGLIAFAIVHSTVSHSSDSAIQVTGTSAGSLQGGSSTGRTKAVHRGGSATLGLAFLRNVGTTPIKIQSVRAVSASPGLTATPGHLWLVPPGAPLTLPTFEAGWPPTHPLTKPPSYAPTWVQPHPSLPGLPRAVVLPPGRRAQVVYGIFLHTDPSRQTRITALEIRAEAGGSEYIWTLPQSFTLE